jgi:phosphate transport system permease protein
MEATGIGAGPAGGNPPSRLQAPSRRYGEKAIFGLLALCGILSIVTTTAIVVSLIGPTIGFFEVVPVDEFVFGTDWTPQFEPPSFGVLAIVAGTLNVALWAMLFAIPIGLGAAIYMSEYASPRVRKTVKPIL